MGIKRIDRRNPNTGHEKSWIAYRERKGRPKARLDSSRGQQLTFERYKRLVEDYEKRADEHLDTRDGRAWTMHRQAEEKLRRTVRSGKRAELEKESER